MDHKSISTGCFPISLPKALFLIGALVYLQLLYLISFIVRPLSNSRHEFPPFKQPIHRVEAAIINSIIGAVPLSAYGSATATVQQSRLFHGNGLLDQTDGRNSTCLPPSWLRAMPPDPYRFCIDGPDHPTLPPQTHPRPGSSVYDTLCKIGSSTRGSISSIASSAIGRIFRHPAPTAASQPVSSIALNQNLYGPHSDIEEQMPQEHSILPVKNSNPFLEVNMSCPVSTSAPARIVDHFSDPGPTLGMSSGGRWKGKGRAVQPASSLVPVLFGQLDDADLETLQMNRSPKYHSIESYPGKFPVSDHLEYSFLATAHAIHGRGTTSVRPFSDY
ncbi:hypothetical protein PENANT_c001G03387 [Penicillium antarcticum]|uniref:Uncharacterized protein n=1 Tax=Penicillium antarcticum TaxID=416450 RepID=A0A1V6QN09_9EURO|nr:uncharacterized protein N7508_010768 [Penicillium antarcticum]KAJ5295947.1 hypothetical protein N7508_010768 [Penicillium antarcticum]OQD90624.1 hypothetical protein PENANT_c001G03387 [Penicillium antarcticum]